MKNLHFLLFTFFILFHFSSFAQDPAGYNIHKMMLKEPAKVQSLSEKLHAAIYAGKLKCYKNNLKDPYSTAEARILGTKSMTVEYIPNPINEPDKVEYKDTTLPYSSKKITGYAVDFYKVKVPVVKDSSGNKSKNKAESGKVNKNKKDKKAKVKDKNKADKDEAVEMKEEIRPAFAPYYEPGDFLYWIRFEDLAPVLTEAEINLLKKEFLKQN